MEASHWRCLAPGDRLISHDERLFEVVTKRFQHRGSALAPVVGWVVTLRPYPPPAVERSWATMGWRPSGWTLVPEQEDPAASIEAAKARKLARYAAMGDSGSALGGLSRSLSYQDIQDAYNRISLSGQPPAEESGTWIDVTRTTTVLPTR